MHKPATLSLIFNAVGVLLALFVVGYIINAALRTDVEAACHTRYPAAMRFALRSDTGTLLGPIELQARAGASEWGILNNAKVISEGPDAAALEVTLAPVPEREASRTQRANGVGFQWLPAGMSKAGAACLSYKMWVPKDFAYSVGGVLPGIYGITPAALTPESTETRFGMRPEWRALGLTGLYVSHSGLGYKELNQRKFELERGRWLQVEQELVLNATGKSDGIARLWVDGQLKAEHTGLTLRNRPDAAIAGVRADIGYLHEPAKPGVLLFSAFELAWR